MDHCTSLTLAPPVQRPELDEIRNEPLAVQVRVESRAPPVAHPLHRQNPLVQFGQRPVFIAAPTEARGGHLDHLSEFLTGPAIDSIGQHLLQAHLVVLDEVLVHGIFGGEHGTLTSGLTFATMRTQHEHLSQ